MHNLVISNREKNNIKPISIKRKDKYYSDLINLEMSLTGRTDSFISNIFIQESSQLIINSIVLFEQGYFDAAFYTLRQSLEVSTTMVYLADLDKIEKEEKLSDWKEQNSFPTYNRMISFLEKNKSNFSEIKSLLFEYFESLNIIKRKLNKYVHKQGLKTFYVIRNSPFHPVFDENEFTVEFEGYLKECIGALAIFRLAIDPFPLLLTEYEIYIRTDYLITEGFSEDFLDFYIGRENCNKLKQTQHYQSLFQEILKENPKNEFTTYVVKDRFIDKGHLKEILDQSDLLSSHEFISALIHCFSEKVSIVFAGGIFDMFFSSTQSNRVNPTWDSVIFDEIKNNMQNYNLNFDNVYISKIQVFEEFYFFEHNEKLTEHEVMDYKKLSHNLNLKSNLKFNTE